MQSRNISNWRGISIILLITCEVHLLLFIGGCYGINNSGSGSKSETREAGVVRVNASAESVVLENGMVEVRLAVPEGYITGIRYGGIDNVLDANNKLSQRGYWDIASSADLDDDNTDELLLTASSFKIISQTPDQAEISFLRPSTPTVPLQVDLRYVMLRGTSGFYSYAIFERHQGLPPLQIDQIRTVYKLENDKFHYMAVSDKIQRIMPMLQDRTSGQPLAYKEAVLLTHPTNPDLKGEVDDKYQYSCEDKDNKVHGWISFDPPVGVWIITPTDEFRLGGPHKQDLTAHAGPNLLAMFHSTHYAGPNLSMSFQNGEPWKKVFGPYFVHLNSISGQADPRTLWGRAKNQMLEEVKKWPYNFPLSEDFAKANERGSVAGRLLVTDNTKAPVPAASAWIGLSPPGDVGSWQTQVKGYQFWTQTDAEGKFVIKNVLAGSYNLFAWVPGFIGDYKYSQSIIITPGKQLSVDDLVYTPPRNGPTLWEIGIPDRSAAEFFIPEPRNTLTNRLYTHDTQDKYRQYGLWDRYSDVYPKEDLIYTVNVSDYRKDWFYAHVPRRSGDTYVATTWQIRFTLTQVVPNSAYTLQIALASASQAEIQVRVNKPDMTARPIFTTLLIGRDNAIARHGIHGLYKLYSIQIQSSLLNTGTNTIFLTQSRGKDFFRGVMYDYLRLEAPPKPQ
ncbi:hypothetical protein RND81_11G238200 [Saponaria officinalis]|uniref:rhamnogalacturonan endolyase n=1 Tax=Saponaria officinalis TaxID=3572 RepID=A0AAW1HQ52_SAPOF